MFYYFGAIIFLLLSFLMLLHFGFKNFGTIILTFLALWFQQSDPVRFWRVRIGHLNTEHSITEPLVIFSDDLGFRESVFGAPL